MTNQGHELRVIPGQTENRYIVSRDGRVFRELKPSINDKGYKLFPLCENGSRRQMYVHRAVCGAFNGLEPEGGRWVNHKNGLKQDNSADNLEWVTPQENSAHAYATGLSKCIVGQKERAGVLERLAAGESQAEIARSFGVSESTISRVITGRHSPRKK